MSALLATVSVPGVLCLKVTTRGVALVDVVLIGVAPLGMAMVGVALVGVAETAASVVMVGMDLWPFATLSEGEA